MKRAIKYFAAVLAAALLCLSLVACGGSAKKYNFKEVTVGGSAASMAESMLSPMVSTFNAAYKDSSIEVGDGEIVWTYTGGEGKMTYTMDGDKYDLAGEMVEKLKTGLTGMSEATMKIYGEETDDGFRIVESVSLSGLSVEIIFNFTNA